MSTPDHALHRSALVATGEVARFRIPRLEVYEFFAGVMRRAQHEGMETFVASPRPLPSLAPSRVGIGVLDLVAELAEDAPLADRLTVGALFLIAFVPIDPQAPRQRPVIVEVA